MSLFDLVKDTVTTAKNMGQELVIDLPKFIAGKRRGDRAATEKARRDGVIHGTQGLKDLNKVLKNSVLDEVISKLPYGEKVRGVATQGLDTLTDIFDKEMKRQGIIPSNDPLSNASEIVVERAAPKLASVPHAAGVAKKALQHCA